MLLGSLNLEVVARIFKTNRSLPSSKNPHFQNDGTAQPFFWKWVLLACEWKIISISKDEHLFWYRDPGELGNRARCLPYGLKKVSCNDFSIKRNWSWLSASPRMKGNTGYYCFQNLDFLGLEILNSAQGIRNPSSTDKESVSHSEEYRLRACLGLTGSMSIHAATECTPDFPSGLFPAWCGHNLLLAYSRLLFSISFSPN